MRSANKRVLSVAVALCLLFAASPAFADSVELDVHTGTEANGNITAEVVLDGTLTASGVQFALSYDDSRLQLVDSQNGELNGSYTVNDADSGIVRLVWYSVNGVDVSGESSVLKLTFAPKADGEANIGFDPGALNTMVVDGSLANVAAQTNGATVSVKGTGTAPSSSGTNPVPVVASNPPSPIPTPMEHNPTPRPPEKDVEAAPSPSPRHTVAAQINTPSASPMTNGEQTVPVAEPPVSATPIMVENYEPPQLANDQNSNTEPENVPQIEVVHAAAKEPSYTWLWISGGVLLLLAAGYIAYMRIKKK